MSYDEFAREAADMAVEGWDFSALDGRMIEDEPSWNYRALVRSYLPQARSLLDMGTGGGELLASIGDLPKAVTATEGWPPNIAVAQSRLEPLGVEVVAIPDDEESPLPLPDNAFDLIINRHEYFDAGEVRRVLAPGGLFITQQVGGDDLCELNTALAAPAPDFLGWDLGLAGRQLADAGLTIVDTQQQYCHGEFRDIGAVLMYLRICPWQIPGYDSHGFESRLRELHERISTMGPLRARHHRFLVVARG